MARRRTPIDAEIGKRLRAVRREIGASQTALAEAVGVTFPQIQKYENGTDRISAGRLLELAHALGVDVSYFFEGLRPKSRRIKHRRQRAALATTQTPKA